MPKIFLIKKRLHEQQLGLQEGQELLASKTDPLCTGSPLDDAPIPLLSKKDCAGKLNIHVHKETIHCLNHVSLILFLNCITTRFRMLCMCEFAK